MLERILPPQVAAAEQFAGDERGGGRGEVLFPGEQAAVARAVDRRRQEFAAGRACARAALAGLGLPPAPILCGERGAPQWPAGVAGSITHCDGYRAAAVARTSDLASLGVDAEPDQPLPAGVLDMISTAPERARLAGLARPAGPAAPAAPPVSWDRLLFSGKEAVYKAWFPLARRWLDFGQADLTIGPRHEAGPPVPGSAPVTAGQAPVTAVTGGTAV
ncbi:MAG: 4'-phosphopantetheinyl transferase superfamily protein, partial [Actinobacteria bacterium]|nr:4'-phosphopantetheinyl transferase superfamily protein [Actinomycetota bacterium]